MIDLSNVSDIITALVAIAGLGLSIYNLYINRRDKKPRLVAKISNGFLTYGPELSPPMLLLEIANAGEKKVMISAVEIAWRKHKAVFIKGIDGTRDVPFELPAGESANFWTPLEDFASSLEEEGVSGKVRVRACFRDAIGNQYLSKKLKVDVNEWSPRATAS
ncbi:MAG: hypothetical protein E3J21_03300 [Anaerolineales bacterium]|nr:MAG: hypothetical protein E3J21_03300 [Anaerolineales bacterium]